jgi:signal transduction histidine kinase
METVHVRRLSQLVPPTRLAVWAAPLAVAAFALLGALQARDRSPWVATGAVLVAAGAVRLTARDRPVLSPIAAALSGAAVALLGNGSASNVGWFAICILVARLCFVASTRVTVAFWAAGVLAFGLEWWLTTDDRGWSAWIAGTTFTAFACLLARRDRDLAEQLRIAQAGLADRVRSEERGRIARELHDVIAHSLTVSLLHVSSARLALAETPAEAERALAEAERLGRECLTEVRQVVGLLRRDEVTGLAPLPGAAQLSALVAQFDAAGADVVFTVDGAADDLGATVGLTLYRILQEALTNAARHAPGAVTRVGLSVTPDAAVLTVDSAGAPGTGKGDGLLSMRERAELLGGTCTAGPAAGGWRVHATIPRHP